MTRVTRVARTVDDAPSARPLHVDGEVGWLRRVLVCSPGEELRRVPPDQRDRYLMEDVLWLERAREQHQAFTRALSTLMRAGAIERAPAGRRSGAASGGEVVDLREELARVLSDKTEEAAALALLEEVVRLEPDLRPAEADEVVASLRARLVGPSPAAAASTAPASPPGSPASLRTTPARARLVDDLLAGVLTHPPAPGRRIFQICPSPNVMFARDYQFVLGGGAFLSSMAKHVRRKEPVLSRFLFDHALGQREASFDLKQVPAYGSKVRQTLDGASGELLIEGGDVMALTRDTIVVGISERTTWRGATALVLGLRWLKERHPEAFPFTELCAVELPSRRAMMHLDTVFTLVDRGLALAFPPLTFPGSREEMGVYASSLTDGPEAAVKWQWAGFFSAAMSRRLSSEGRPLTLIAGGGSHPTLQHREQWCDACNALAVGPGVAISYRRNTRTLESLRALDAPSLRESGAVVVVGASGAPARHLRPFTVLDAEDVSPARARAIVRSGDRAMVCIDGGELGRARGGPHCMTMALEREPETDAD